jgi:hypothetical protein
LIAVIEEFLVLRTIFHLILDALASRNILTKPPVELYPVLVPVQVELPVGGTTCTTSVLAVVNLCVEYRVLLVLRSTWRFG